MADTPPIRDRLLRNVNEKKAQLAAYIARVEPRGNRLTATSIICGGLAGLLTAGPAVGGPALTKTLTEALNTSPETAPSWRILCAAAALLSFLSTTALSMYKTQDLASKLAKAQVARARLEALGIALESTDFAVDTAAQQYTTIVQDVSFVPS